MITMDNEMFGFYRNALRNSLCKEYKDEWRACGDDKKKLVALAVRQQSLPFLITYCNNGTGLNKEYLKRSFSSYINQPGRIRDADGVKGYKYSLFVDYNKDVIIIDDVSAFMWCKINNLNVPQTKAVTIYCGCDSKVHLNCDGYNSVFIYLFDTSRVILDDVDENSTVTIYKYSETCGVLEGKYCLGKIKQHQKQLRL